MAEKPMFPRSNTFTFNEDETYSDEQHIFVKMAKQTDDSLDSEAKAKLAAITKVGINVNDEHPNEDLKKAGVRAMSISVMLLQDQRAQVIIQWGVPAEPILDGTWVYEVQTVSRTITRGLDINEDPIKIKYVPLTIPAPDRAQFLIDNARTNNRGATTQVRKDLIQVIGRRKISFTNALNFEAGKTLFQWPRRYINYVNEEYKVGDNTILTAGQWMCNNMRIFSTNHNWSFNVEASFVYDVDGFEEFIGFIDQFGLRPSDIVVSDDMKKPWPAKDDPDDPDPRVSDAEPYGISRPQVLPGLRNFNEEPFFFNLGGF